MAGGYFSPGVDVCCVMTDELQGIDRAAVWRLVEVLPIPMAVLKEDGEPLALSGAFRARFGLGALQWPMVAGLLRSAIDGWTSIRPPEGQGADAPVLARVVFVEGARVLILDDGARQDLIRRIEDLYTQVVGLRRLVAVDALTGAWNRTHFGRVIVSEMDRSRRFRQPLSLIFVDVDHFKTINDIFGHTAGDQVLRDLVQAIGSAVRSSDLLFRWGGDEFVVLAPQTGRRQAGVLAEKIAAVVAALDFATVGSVGLSLGVAEYASDESVDVWVGRADTALYRAKHGGRGRIAIDDRGASDFWAADSGPSVVRLVWQEAYQCGEPAIDRQHRQLFDLGNNLFKAAAEELATTETLNIALDGVLAHIAMHFADEERILAEHGFADLEAHRLAHARLLARAADLRAAVIEGAATLGDLVEFLGDGVIAQHLFKADRAFFPVFASRDASARVGR